MKLESPLRLGIVLAIGVLASTCARAEQHRATQLGNANTRFAEPLNSPEDLRARFRDEKLRADIESILQQWGWKGNSADLYRAATSEEITPVKLPVGAQLPFMSSRKNGRPVVLRNVLWAGREPIDAYAFVFASQGRRYRCVTPKLCSNFYLMDLGPEILKLVLEAVVPDEASACENFKMKVLVRNAGNGSLTRVRMETQLAPQLSPVGNPAALALEIPVLRAGEVREIEFPVVASVGGTFLSTYRAASAEGVNAETSKSIVMNAPLLVLECTAPAEVPIGRPVEVCLTVRNSGGALEPQVTLNLPVSAGATLASVTEGGTLSGGRLTWSIPALPPQGSKQVCATFSRPDPGILTWTPTAQGTCAPSAQGQCTTRVAGVPGVLLEAVDTEDPVEAGKEVTYVLRVTNQGSSDLTQVRLICTLPPIQDYVSSTGKTAIRAEGRTLMVEPVAALESKGVATWTIRALAREAGIARFRVRLTTDQLAGEVVESESTTQY